MLEHQDAPDIHQRGARHQGVCSRDDVQAVAMMLPVSVCIVERCDPRVAHVVIVAERAQEGSATTVEKYPMFGASFR